MKAKTIIYLSFSVLYCIFSNAQKKHTQTISYQKTKIDTLLEDKINIRTLNIDANKIWFAADKNRYGYYDLAKKESHIKTIDHSKTLEFRSSAITPNHFLVLSTVSPALMYQIDKDNGATKLVFQNHHEKAFYDSLQFWNEKEGIAVGDPIDNNFSIVITKDGGATWTEVPKDSFPKSKEGEGAFAASNTTIVIQGKHTWIVSGGKNARIFYSSNKGKSWRAYETPMIQGQSMTGIFSAAFYNSKIGCIAGGNYEIPNQNFGNKATTTTAGKTWQLMAEKEGPGYISCVQYMPKSLGKKLLTVGATGIHFSKNGGESWQQISKDPTLFTLRFLNTNTAIAAGKNKIIRILFE
jgi:photosystem II stability/assembly factor-like uncharacterized protein